MLLLAGQDRVVGDPVAEDEVEEALDVEPVLEVLDALDALGGLDVLVVEAVVLVWEVEEAEPELLETLVNEELDAWVLDED